MRLQKLRDDLSFYFWTGICLYVLNNVLNVVDFYQRRGLDLWGYLGFLLFLGFNIFVIHKVRQLRNWARNLFVVKFVVFTLTFYSFAIFLRSGSWMYSAHFPHGALQHMSNMGNFIYELLFTIYLIKRNVRIEFIRA